MYSYLYTRLNPLAGHAGIFQPHIVYNDQHHKLEKFFLCDIFIDIEGVVHFDLVKFIS